MRDFSFSFKLEIPSCSLLLFKAQQMNLIMSLKMEHFKKRLCCVVYQWLYCLPRANVALHIFVNVNQKMFMLQINRQTLKLCN